MNISNVTTDLLQDQASFYRFILFSCPSEVQKLLVPNSNSCPGNGPSSSSTVSASATNIPSSTSCSATTHVAIANNVGAPRMKSNHLYL